MSSTTTQRLVSCPLVRDLQSQADGKMRDVRMMLAAVDRIREDDDEIRRLEEKVCKDEDKIRQLE